MSTLAEIQRLAWQIAEEQGQHEGLRELSARDQLLIRCAFLHGEVSEIGDFAKKYGVAPALHHIAQECADVLIHLAELCQQFGIDLDTAVALKMDRNRQRPYGYGTPLDRQETRDDPDAL
ncbi:MAG TPA: hypothetical protein VF077_12350 [Nitrospiraceae bacterium]